MSNPLPENLFKQFDALTCRLSPENLSCDGECSRIETNRRRNVIMAEWRELEKQAGRTVSFEEIENEWLRRENERFKAQNARLTPVVVMPDANLIASLSRLR